MAHVICLAVKRPNYTSDWCWKLINSHCYFEARSHLLPRDMHDMNPYMDDASVESKTRNSKRDLERRDDNIKDDIKRAVLPRFLSSTQDLLYLVP